MMTADPFGFSDPAVVASYPERALRTVPGLEVVHRLLDHLLAESVPVGGRVLVVGAGGGLELAYLAERHAGWTFDGVDPSAAMLDLARTMIGPRFASRTTLHLGYVADAPDGPFDAATCVLTLHFLEPDERLRTLQEIRRRLRPGAPLLTFQHSVPDGDARTVWLERFARFVAGAESDPAQIARSVEAIVTRLPILTPQADEAMLREAGFGRVGQFYAALTLRGWVAHA